MIVSSQPSSVDRQRLGKLAGVLRDARRTLRYVDYRQAERDCELLAGKLRAEFTDEELAGFCYRPIPRGGLIVLGMLSYALGLHSDQLLPPKDAATPCVLVDDCALTGARVAQALAQIGAGRSVIVAHLYSHPALRGAVAGQESQVLSCLAAHDLSDHPPADADTWRKRWQERLGGERYWVGRPEWIAFAWSEPDRPFWNPVSESVEDGWRFVAPHRCLKNRYHLGVRATASGWLLADEVVFGEFDGLLWLWEPLAGELFSVDGVALEMFRLLLQTGTDEESIRFLVARWQVDEATVRKDFLAFAGSLRERGVLVPPATGI